MTIISQETFDKFTEEEKENVRKTYQTLKRNKDTPLKTDLNEWYAGRVVELEELLGEENLQSKPKIRIWEDIGNNENNFCENYLNFYKTANGNYCLDADKSHDIKVILKVIATIKIAKLIELGYGGMITDEEWQNPNEKFVIKPYYQRGKFFLEKSTSCNYKCFIAFHTYEQAEEFMSYSENVELLKQYHML